MSSGPDLALIVGVVRQRDVRYPEIKLAVGLVARQGIPATREQRPNLFNTELDVLLERSKTCYAHQCFC